MKTKKTIKPKPNTLKRLATWAVVIAAILTIPRLANWPWTGTDFVAGAILLFGSATLFELAIRNVSSKNQQIIIGFAIALLFILAWAELAVGLFGTPLAGD